MPSPLAGSVSHRPPGWPAPAWRLLPVGVIAVALLLARLGPGPLAAAGALTAIATAGAAGIGAARLGLRGLEVVVVGSGMAIAVVGALSLVLYVVAPSAAAALTILVIALALGPIAWTLCPPPPPERVSWPRWPVVAVLAAAAAAGILAALAGPYFPALWDGPFHAAALRRLVESVAWLPPSPYFPPEALPVPQYGLDPWYPVLALVSLVTGSDALDTVRWVAPAVGAFGVTGMATLAGAAVSASGACRWARDSALLLTAALAVGVEGVLGGLFAWRTGYLPQQAAASVLLPGALLVLVRFAAIRRSAGMLVAGALCAALAATVVLVHSAVGATVAAAAVGEMVAVALVALVRRRREPPGRPLSRSRWAAGLPAAVALVGLAAAAALTLPSLLTMTRAAGPADYGNPDFAAQIRQVGPWVMVRPSLLIGSWTALVGLLAALTAVALRPWRPGIRALALGTIVAWAVVLVPPVATVISELASTLYLRRLAAVPVTLAVPLVGAVGGLLVVAMARRLPRRIGWHAAQRVVAFGTATALAVTLAVVGLAVVVAQAPDAERPAWITARAWERLRQGDESGQIRQLGADLGGFLPSGSIVLSDPVTSYWLPVALDVLVVAVPAIHSLSIDPDRVSVRGRTRAGRDVMRFLRTPGLSVGQQRAILDRYGVTHVVLDPARARRSEREFHMDRRRTSRIVARDIGPERLAVYARR